MRKKLPTVDTSIIWCGDNLEKLKHSPDEMKRLTKGSEPSWGGL